MKRHADHISRLAEAAARRKTLHSAAVTPRCEALEPRLLLSGSLLITEFQASNNSTLADVDGQFNDWIELQNTSAAPLNLSGWKLRDSNASWTFPSKTLSPGEIIVVFASDKNRTNPAQELHTNFKLSAGGELLELVQPNGTVAQSFNPFPQQFEDISYGLEQTSTTLLSPGAPVAYKVPTAGDAATLATWMQPAFDDAAFATSISVPTSTVLLTEISTGSNDYLEVHNVSSQAINTTNWKLAVSDNSSNINAVNSVVKTLPSQLLANQVHYYSDVGTEPTANQWGTSISWPTTTSGWAMLLDQNNAVVDFVVWGFSTSAIATFNVTINGTNITAANLPWSGSAASASTATNTNSLKRTGTADSNTSANWAVSSPQSKGTTNAGLTVPFPNGSTPALTGIGYVTGGTGAPFNVSVYKAAGAINNLTEAEAVIATPALQASVSSGQYSVVNFLGTGAVGNYSSDAVYPGSTSGQDVDDYVSLSTGKIYIPRAGIWTFGVSSDDGFRLDVSGNGVSLRTEFDGLRGATNTLGTLNVPVAGVYDFRLLQFDHLGGSSVEFFAAEGSFSTFSAASFDLVGDVSSGGLAGAGIAAEVRTNLGAAMQGVNASLWTRIDFNVADPATFDSLALKMKYDAGFVAYLNGVEVARRNAPASLAVNSAATAERTDAAAILYESMNITTFLPNLVTGNNVLAIHGLNSSAGDVDFLILPEIHAGVTGTQLQYFSTATPGATNAAGVIAFVKDTKFSHNRGFYDAPFQVTITTNTEAAVIRFTTDGTTPSATVGTIYTGPITIDKTTVLRAIATKTGFQPTDVDTQSYFFISDILQQPATAPAGWPAAGSLNGQVLDYGMDPDIVNSATWGPQLAAALTDIPTMSIVTDTGHLFSATTGIYVNADQDSIVWERPTSLELIDPQGEEEGFQINAGIRIRGGYSRNDGNPKHSFRFFFREEYGDSKLNYALFGEEGSDSFDKIDFRTAQNYSWSFGGDARNIMNRDVFSRDVQRDLEDPYTRSRYYHVYINGQYWGIYQTQERAEAAYAADYFGGEPEDYDVVKVEAGPYTINATDGNLTAWNAFWTLAGAGFETDAKYYAVQGKNPDGTRNPALPVYLDQDNLIDYMIIILYGGNLDAPISNFLGNASPNNWYGVYNHTTQDQGFQFFAHDSEHTILTDNLNTNRNGPFPAGDTFDKSNPQWIHQKLMSHPEYRMRFADRVQELLFNDGPLTVQNNIERFLSRADEIDTAIIAESARWGDAKVATPFTKDHWQAEINNLVTNYFPQRGNIFLNQLKATTLPDGGGSAPLFPSVSAPSFNTHGGIVGANFPLTIAAPAGTIYYTMDGSDPRLPGGSINPNALVFNSTTTSSTLIPAGSNWKYFDDGIDLGTLWRNGGYDDSLWPSGPGQLGYGDGDEATVVDFGPNAASKYVTTYFRNTFSVTDAQRVTGLTLRMIYDDGANVFINGQRVLSANLAADAAFGALALSNRAAPDESAFFNFTIDPSVLVDGVNTIAVEMHQALVDSADLGFDLELTVQEFQGTPIALNASGPVRTRALNGAEWSAITEAQFLVNTPPTSANLVITELNYNPTSATDAELAAIAGVTASEFEFIELLNIGQDVLDLFGLKFSAGIEFDFSDSPISTLAPGQRVLVVANPAAFALRYGAAAAASVAGEYVGQLDDAGEQITLVNSAGEIVADFIYGDSGAWPGRADGGGSTMEVTSPGAAPIAYNDSNSWRSSSEVGGTPGAAGLGPDNRIIINEVLSHTDLPLKDSIELFNTTGAAINVGGWYITDSTGVLAKFRIPNGTIIAAGGYLVFDEDDFNPGLGTLPGDFSFNAAHGDDAFLLQADPATGMLQRFVDAVEFGAQKNGESWGRFPSGDAAGKFTPMLSRTLGSANAQPRVGPIVISEVMYQPTDPGNLPLGMTVNQLEFVEILNPTAAPVSLLEWRLRGGVDYDFDPTPGAGRTLGAGQALTVISFDPGDPLNADKLSAFRAYYGIDASVPLIGPFIGDLNNAGESVRLERPDEPPADEPGFFPRLLEDEADYGVSAPWPTTPAGGGDSLTRKLPASFGSLATSFVAAPPTPGTQPPSDLTPPTIIGAWVSGGQWTPAFKTFLTDNGLGEHGLGLSVGATQLRTLAWTNINQVSIRFSEDVAVAQGDLSFWGVTTPSVTVSGFSYDSVLHLATWTLQSAGLGRDKWLIEVADTVADTAGNALDGDWMTEVSTFAAGSGNGVAGGRFLFRFNVLPGDIDGNNLVQSSDLINVRNGQFKTTTTAGYNYRLDLNANGSVQSNDLITTRNSQFTFLPPGEPTGGTSGAAVAMSAAAATPTIAPADAQSQAASGSARQAAIASFGLVHLARQTSFVSAPTDFTRVQPLFIFVRDNQSRHDTKETHRRRGVPVGIDESNDVIRETESTQP